MILLEGDKSNSHGAKQCRRGHRGPRTRSCHCAFAQPKLLPKDPFPKFYFHHHPDPDDIWSQCGLLMRLTRKSFTIFPRVLALTRKP